jgi:hypothetical protein
MNKVKEKHISKLKLLSFYVIMIGLTMVVCFVFGEVLPVDGEPHSNYDI